MLRHYFLLLKYHLSQMLIMILILMMLILMLNLKRHFIHVVLTLEPSLTMRKMVLMCMNKMKLMPIWFFKKSLSSMLNHLVKRERKSPTPKAAIKSQFQAKNPMVSI